LLWELSILSLHYPFAAPYTINDRKNEPGTSRIPRCPMN
jgi:hypothetical protein